ncbi:MAG TPA: hypothetical protein VFR01_01875 [Geobacterales bacterium]|nr:hypothetical protein [Geobacterales bacterium]
MSTDSTTPSLATEEALKHSGYGIASFVVSLVQGVLTMAVIVGAGMMSTMGPQQDHQVGFMIVGLFIFLGIFVHLVGVGLGITGLVQKNRKRVFSILGLIFNAVALLVVLLLMVVGFMAK